MNEQVVLIAQRIKELREFAEYTEAEMAAKINMTEAEYIQCESGNKDIPIGIIYSLASILDVEPAVLIMGEQPEDSEACVYYDGSGKEIERHPGYKFIPLAEGFANKQMKPMLVILEPEAASEMFTHGGQELNYVLEGKLRVNVGGTDYYLREGDSIYFDPSISHTQMAMGGTVKFLTVIND